VAVTVHLGVSWPRSRNPIVVLRQCPSTDDGTGGLTVARASPPSKALTNGVCSHDDVAQVIRRSNRPQAGNIGPSGWSNQSWERPARRARGGLPAVVLLIPLVLGLLGASVSPQVAHGDDLTDAKARQTALKQEVAAQKARVSALNDLQNGLAAEISDTRSQLRKVGADLSAVKKKIVNMEAKIEVVKADYASLVRQVQSMDAELARVSAQEEAKRVQLGERRALLADRVREAYDTDRTSPLETFLSGGTFTDLLAEMSYYIDVGEQDQALADQIAQDKETLAALHQTVADTRVKANELRLETAAQKRALDKSLLALKETKAQLAKLEKAVARTLKEQQARYAALKRSKANAAAIIRKAAADQKRLARTIDNLIARQIARGNIPSEFNGSMRWPMDQFNISGDFGCSTFSWYAPGNGCAHFHNGIDLVAPYGAKVKAAAAGTVVYIGWNWADGADPAWIVVVAHSGSLKTWYAHMQPKRPTGVEVGKSVKKGQVLGYEGSTGNSTGAHLHWMVELNGNFVNPRLFL
jgi:murein DD-endopeptidase MepM/ murein hydrolase activator NlpD